MNNIQNVVEYYDELYPINESQKNFFITLVNKANSPAKFLRIGCGTGLLENYIAKSGADVTGLDTTKEILESANLRRRFPNMAIRFFQMSSIEMTHFLGKKFYDIIACLNDKLIYIHDKTLMKKFFFDCKSLLKDNGYLVLQLTNFDPITTQTNFNLPIRESIRSKITESISYTEETGYLINQSLENSSGRIIPLLRNEKVYPIHPDEIKKFASEAGFTKIDFYNNYQKEPFTSDSKSFVCIIQ